MAVDIVISTECAGSRFGSADGTNGRYSLLESPHYFRALRSAALALAGLSPVPKAQS
jgi:hypothetical protein